MNALANQSGAEAKREGRVDFRGVLRQMHLAQAKAWRESRDHWRRVAEQHLERDNVDAAAFAKMMADMVEGYAEEHERYAKEFEFLAAGHQSNGAARPSLPVASPAEGFPA